VKKIVDSKSQEIKRDEEIRKSLMITLTPEFENINETMLSNQEIDEDENQSEDKKDIVELK
jgi:hypothetical protein